MNFWTKKLNNIGIIANKTGIKEDKLKELKEGKREVNEKTMDELLKIVNETTNAEVDIKKQEIKRWYEETNIQEKMKEFGYSKYAELARALGISKSSVSQLVSGAMKRDGETGIKFYNFFQDDFNKNVSSFTKHNKKKTRFINEPKEIKEFFDKNGIDELIKMYGYNDRKTLAKELNIGESTIGHIITGEMSYNSKTARKIYDFFKNKENSENLVNMQQLTLDSINIPETSKQPLEIEINTVRNDIMIQPIKEVNEIEELIKRCDELAKENKKLLHQIEMYEKLIERL